MKRGLKIGLIAISSLVALMGVVISLVCWLVFTPAKLTEIVNKASDKYLDCTMTVGEIDLTFFSTFPNVSLQLTDVALINPVDSTANDTVAVIQHCQAVLDVDAFINDGAVVLHGLQLDGGWANLYTNAEGVANYMVFPIDTLADEESDTTAFAVPDMDVREVDIRDIRVDYYDASTGQKAVIEGLAMQLDGQKLGERLLADLSASLRKLSVIVEGDSAMNASVEDVTLDVNGTLQDTDAKFDVRLTAKGMDALASDAKAYIEQLEWTLSGSGKDGTWTGSTMLTTLPVEAAMMNDAPMSATFTGMQFKADAQWQGGDLVVSPSLALPGLTVELGGEHMLDKADIQFCTTLHTDTLLSHMEFSQGLLALNEHKINWEGGVELPDTSTINAAIRFETNHCDITRLLALVPQSYHYLLDGIDLRGGMALKGEGGGSLINGEVHIGEMDATLLLDNIDLEYNDSVALQSHTAHINMVYDGQRDYLQGNLEADVMHMAMTGMADAQLCEVEGAFAMRQAMRISEGNIDAKARIAMDKLTATMDTLGLYAQETAMDITLHTDNNEKLHFDASLYLDTLNAGIGSLLAGSTGKLSIKTHASYEETGDNFLSQWDPQLAVDVLTGDVASSMLTVPVSIPHIQFDYADGHFTINDSRILLGNSDFGLRGDVHSIDSFINKTGLLKAELDFWSAYTDVTQLMDLVSGFGSTGEALEEDDDDTPEASTAEDDPFMVPLGVDVKLNTDITTVNVNGFKFDDIDGHIAVKDGVLVLEEMGFTSDAARMQLTAMYKSPRKNHLFVGFDFHLLDIEIEELIHMIPDVDSIIPMLSAFDGEAEFHLAAETNLKSNYDIKLSTLRAAAAIEGKDLVVMDNKTFNQISKYLLFEKETKNVVDSISVELTVFKDEVDLYPFLISMDDYKAVIGGRHNINEDFDFNYHISLTSPLRLGLDIGGTLDDMQFKLTECKYAQMYNPKKQNVMQARTLQLKKIISDSLKDNVKPQDKR